MDYDTKLNLTTNTNKSKPKRVTNHNATITDHTLTNSFDIKIDTIILRVDTSDHFPIFFTSKSINVKTFYTVPAIKVEVNTKT